MPTWLGALLAGTADGSRQREFPPARECEATSVSPLSGACWMVWAYLIPPFPKMSFLRRVEEVILNIIEHHLSFLKIQMLLYWLVGSAVPLLCQSLLTPNFPTRQTDQKERQILSSFT